MQRLPGAIFQQGNARPHTTKVSKDCLHTLTTLPWPARSPDLSPIKHIWDHLGRRVGHPSSLNELEARYYCTQGYSLISENKPYDGINECLANKTWSGISHKISCADTSPPNITCPKSIVTTTDPSKATATVTWEEANADDNVFVSTVSIRTPPFIRKPPYSFSINVTKVVYEAYDSSNHSSTCSFTVTVLG
ncbi:sushi, von Willebrand factor type A, EGF and pentraxin domain-containing protein 1 [Trichonephila clavipes]|uniref:Sushi, von Willebrand factor type A, EGF and pentraxin domain-containing protein 1 n=1 Tax=Trichonephila clavipes TaxID=2585209 RepID=A0A8X6V286_TRICX|nr:sushi, von Willebrand factor type A, EGF and pentraxin domain-containing protein 1 [Trichonephila clavipes]